MGCPHVRGDNPRALASGLSYVQVDKHGITIYIPSTDVSIKNEERKRILTTKTPPNYPNDKMVRSNNILATPTWHVKARHALRRTTTTCIVYTRNSRDSDLFFYYY